MLCEEKGKRGYLSFNVDSGELSQDQEVQTMHAYRLLAALLAAPFAQQEAPADRETVAQAALGEAAEHTRAAGSTQQSLADAVRIKLGSDAILLSKVSGSRTTPYTSSSCSHNKFSLEGISCTCWHTH